MISFYFMKSCGMSPVLHIGIKKIKDKLISHSWVCVDSDIIQTNEQDISSFKILMSIES